MKFKQNPKRNANNIRFDLLFRFSRNVRVKSGGEKDFERNGDLNAVEFIHRDRRDEFRAMRPSSPLLHGSQLIQKNPLHNVSTASVSCPRLKVVIVR